MKELISDLKDKRKGLNSHIEEETKWIISYKKDIENSEDNIKRCIKKIGQITAVLELINPKKVKK